MAKLDRAFDKLLESSVVAKAEVAAAKLPVASASSRLVAATASAKGRVHKLCWQDKVKVSYFRNQILKFSFEPKNERKYFPISALAS